MAHLTRVGLDGFLIHLDVDVLDDTIMPAVDYRLPGGLTHDELRITLVEALTSGRAVALEVTIYNPDFDESGEAGRRLTETLVESLGTDVAAKS